MSQSGLDQHIDILIIDNIRDQARGISQECTKAGYSVGILKCEMTQQEAASHQIPQRIIEKIMGEIERTTPRCVLIDVHLYEQVYTETYPYEENAGSWTGPALMAAILQRFPHLSLVSYSAYQSDKDKEVDINTQIESQKLYYGVDKTPHWSLPSLEAQTIKKTIG